MDQDGVRLAIQPSPTIGSTNFYEAVRDVITRPPLASDYVLRGRGYDD